MNNKVLVGGLIGGIAAFLLGYVIYELALGSTLNDNMMAGLFRDPEEMQWAFLVLGNLFYGFLYAWVLNKAGANSLTSGATTGVILALLIGLTLGFTWYAVSNTYTTMTGLFVDLIGGVVMGLVVGAIIGWWYGRGRRPIVA